MIAFLHRLLSRFSALFSRHSLDADFAEEIAQHIEAATEENIRRGMPPAEARRHAHLALGGVEQARELHRDARGLPWLENSLRDVRFACRSLLRAPGTSVAAVLLLALGIGANTAAFSVLNAFLFKPLPYDHPEELVSLYESSAEQHISQFSVSGPKYLAWHEQNRVFREMGALSVTNVTLVAATEAVPVTVCQVTPSCMSVFRFRTRLGRLFTEDEARPGRDQVVILSHRLWQKHFGAREDIVGTKVILEGNPCTVAGVLEPGGLENWEGGEVMFSPLTTDRLRQSPGAHYYQVFGRMKPGVTLPHCRAEMELLTSRINQTDPAFRDWMPRILSFREDNLGNWPGVDTLFLLQGAVAAVLLLACFNTSCLLLVRGIGRSRETAIRMAIGGSRWQVIRPILIEGGLLSFLGGALGLLLSFAGTRIALHWLAGQDITLWTSVDPDRTALAFTLVLSVATGLVASLLPAWHATKLNPHAALKSGAGTTNGTHHRTLNTLAAAQITLSFLLLVCAGLFIRNVLQLRSVSTGFDPRNVLTLETSVPAKQLPKGRPEAYVDAALERLSALPGVRSAAVADNLVGNGAIWSFWVEGREPIRSGDSAGSTQLRRVSAGYFRTMGVRLLRGRDFAASDQRASEHVAIINQILAERFFQGMDPIGAHVQTGNGIENRYTVIGVCRSERPAGPAGNQEPMIYVPISQGWPRMYSYSFAFAVRTEGRLVGMEQAVKREIRAAGPNSAFQVRYLEEWLEGALLSYRLTGVVFTVFAGTALLLSGLGIYSVIAHLVSRRSNEFGIRLALGATPSAIMRMVLGCGLRLTIIGTLLGLAGALMLGQLLNHFLLNLNPRDPLTFGAVTLMSITAALLACWLPARRAATIDPIESMRAE